MSINTLKINGEVLDGVSVDASLSFNKPQKNVDVIKVPGRNGDLVVDYGTFNNVPITYPVAIREQFPTAFPAIVNDLAKLKGYQRIECSNDPEHFRLGRFVVPETPATGGYNKEGRFD